MKEDELELRHCPKCKRKTIQVKKRVITREGMRYLGGWVVWKMQDGAGYPPPEEYDAEEKQISSIIFYCPQCGKNWNEEEVTPATKVITEELKQEFIVKELVL